VEFNEQRQTELTTGIFHVLWIPVHKTPELLTPQISPLSANPFCASLPLDVSLYNAIKSSASFWKFSGNLFIYKNKQRLFIRSSEHR